MYPTIQPNYFTVPYDTKIATEGLKYLRKVAGTADYQTNFIAGPTAEYVPGDKFPGQTDEEYVINTSVTEYHPGAQCDGAPGALNEL